MKKLLQLLVLISYSVIAQTPIWHYTFDGSSAPVNPQGNFGGALTRVSGGIPTAANYGMDRFGEAGKSLIVRKLDLNNDFLYFTTLSGLPQGNSARTISFWVRYKTPSSKYMFLYGGISSNGAFGMTTASSSLNTTQTFIKYDEAQALFSTFQHTDNPIYYSFNTNDDDAWIHYTITVEASSTKIYKNGVLLGSNNIPLATNGNELRFGLEFFQSNTGPNQDFLLDDFKVYDIALTQAQIKQQYADEVAFSSTDLLAYYGFENDLTCANDPQFNLTAQNPAENTYEAGVVGQSRRFTQNPVYNDILGQSLNLGQFTIMAWEKINVYNNGNDFATVFETNGSMYARRRQNGFRTGFAANATTFVGEGSNIMNAASVWVHHAITFKNSGGGYNALYFRNGELLSVTNNATTSTAMHSFFNKFVVGGGLDGSGNIMTVKRLQDSNIDEVYVYNRVLNQPEILATMYRTTAPTFTSCPTGNVTVTNQAEVDALASCTTINGFLFINASGALDLTPLNNLTTINGTLTVQGITNNQLNIFPNLTTVTGSIQLRLNTFTEFTGFNGLTTASNGIQILQNDNLSSFSGFNSLVNINGSNLGILLNNNLATINAFGNLQNINGLLLRNTQLTNLSFLSSLINNAGQLSIENNPLLTTATFTNPVAHCFCSGITGGDYVRIQNNPLLTTVGNVTLQSSVLGDPTIEFFQINNNPLLSSVGMSLDASASSSSVVNNITLSNNTNLSNLGFLNDINVTSSNILNILNSPITTLNALSGLTNVSSTILLSGNLSLTDISGLNNININNLSGVTINSNSQLATCEATWLCNYLDTASPNTNISNNAVGCEDVSDVINACDALSTSDFELSEISLYPNPSSALVTVEVPNETVSKIELYDMLGKQILQSNKLTVNVEVLEKGVYIVKIITENQKVGVVKLIKN